MTMVSILYQPSILSPLTSSFQKDKSGKLDVKEFHNLKHYVSVTKREYSESYEWQNPGFVTEYQMKNALDVRG